MLSLASLSLSAHGPALRFGRPETNLTGLPSDGTPLILTGLSPTDARAASRVTNLSGWDKTSYSGFFTTQADTRNNMFFWYFPAQCLDCESAPLLIWLQGGPGGSSLFGLFSEMGPFGLSTELKLVPRPTSWNTKYAMLFIDNPVGAGYSFTEQDGGYCTDSKGCVARNLYSLLQQFYTVFPEQQANELYVTGESYGGHYVPAISAFIDTQNRALRSTAPIAAALVGDAGRVHIPLAGIFSSIKGARAGERQDTRGGARSSEK